MNERLLTVHQAAAQLQVKPYTVRHWLRLGRVRGVKIGRDWRISDRELAERTSGEPARIPAKHNPLAAALALSEKLTPRIVAGSSGGVFSSADALDAVRSGSDRDTPND